MSCDCHRRLGPVTPKVDEAELQRIINAAKAIWQKHKRRRNELVIENWSCIEG